MNLKLNKFKNLMMNKQLNKAKNLKDKKKKRVKEEAEVIEEIVVKAAIDLKELAVKLREKEDKEELEEIDQELQLPVTLERIMKDFKK